MGWLGCLRFQIGRIDDVEQNSLAPGQGHGLAQMAVCPSGGFPFSFLDKGVWTAWFVSFVPLCTVWCVLVGVDSGENVEMLKNDARSNMCCDFFVSLYFQVFSVTSSFSSHGGPDSAKHVSPSLSRVLFLQGHRLCRDFLRVGLRVVIGVIVVIVFVVRREI